VVPFAHASDQNASPPVQIKVSSGVFYSNGQSETLNTSDSTTTSVPIMLSIKNARWSFGMSSAYLSVDSPSLNAQGMGDTTLSVGYDLTESSWLTLKLKHKLATGNQDKGLSTGKNDTAIQLDSFYPLTHQTSAFATVGYKKVGKNPGANMQDSPYASAGMGYIYPSKLNIGVSKRLDDPLGVALFASKAIDKTLTLSAFGGLDTTQTTTAGLTLTTQF